MKVRFFFFYKIPFKKTFQFYNHQQSFILTFNSISVDIETTQALWNENSEPGITITIWQTQSLSYTLESVITTEMFVTFKVWNICPIDQSQLILTDCYTNGPMSRASRTEPSAGERNCFCGEWLLLSLTHAEPLMTPQTAVKQIGGTLDAEYCSLKTLAFI